MRLLDALGALISFAAAAEGVLEAAALAYLRFLWRATLWLMGPAALAVVALAASPGITWLQAPWIYTAAVLVATVCMILFTIAAMPLLAARERLGAIPEVQKWLAPTRYLTVIAQTGALTIAILNLLPTAASPRLVPLVLILCVIMALWGGGNVGATLYKIVTTRLVLTIALLSFTAYAELYLPSTVLVLRTKIGGLDDSLASRLVSAEVLDIGPSDDAPLVSSDGAAFPLRSPAGGGRVWFHRDANGNYVFYSGYRVLPDGTQLELADTDAEIAAINEYASRVRIAEKDRRVRDSLDAVRRAEHQREAAASAQRAAATAAALRHREVADSIDADRVRRNRRIATGGSPLWQDANYFGDVLQQLAAGDSVLVSDSLAVPPITNQALVVREVLIVASEGQARAPVGSVVRILGVGPNGTLLSYRFGNREFVGTVADSSSLRLQDDPEQWYGVTTYQGRRGFLPSRATQERHGG